MIRALCGSQASVTTQSRRPVLKAGITTSRRAVRAMAALDPDNASILVCGGSGVALHTTRKLKDMGAWVWMLQRTNNNRPEIENMMAFCVNGDALDQASVTKAFAGIEEVDAVVSTIGGTTKDPSADSEGNINIINEAVRKGVKKFVLVTSVGTGDSKDAPGQQVYDVLKPILLEKEKAENRLKEVQDKMTFVIIRPGGLTDTDPTGKGILTENTGVCGAISRQDVATLVCKALFSEKTDNKVLTACDADRITTSVDYEVFEV